LLGARLSVSDWASWAARAGVGASLPEWHLPAVPRRCGTRACEGPPMDTIRVPRRGRSGRSLACQAPRGVAARRRSCVTIIAWIPVLESPWAPNGLEMSRPASPRLVSRRNRHRAGRDRSKIPGAKRRGLHRVVRRMRDLGYG